MKKTCPHKPQQTFAQNFMTSRYVYVKVIQAYFWSSRVILYLFLIEKGNQESDPHTIHKKKLEVTLSNDSFSRTSIIFEHIGPVFRLLNVLDRSCQNNSRQSSKTVSIKAAASTKRPTYWPQYTLPGKCNIDHMQNSSIMTHTHTRTLHWKNGGKLGGGTHKLTEYLISALALAVASGALPSEHVAFHPGPWPVAPPGTCPVDSTARPGRRPHTAHPATRRHCRQLTQTFELARA